MASRVADKIKLASVDELLCVPKVDGTVEIELGIIYPFKNHPFKVIDDENMENLIESIHLQGILSPVLVRPYEGGGYEMISGHRRLYAAKKNGMKKIPAIVKNFSDDEAIIAMVNANMQREEILPSERGFSLKMKMDAMRHQGTCRHDVDKLSPIERKTATIVGEGSGLTGRSVQRYIRLTELIPELLNLVDEKKISLVCGVEISYFETNIQRYLYEYIKKNGKIKLEQLAILKEQKNLENMTQYTLFEILKDSLKKKNNVKQISFTEKKLAKYFPKDYSVYRCEKIITELLEKWKSENKVEFT